MPIVGATSKRIFPVTMNVKHMYEYFTIILFVMSL